MSTTSRTILIAGVAAIAASGLILIGIVIGVSTGAHMPEWARNTLSQMPQYMSYPGRMRGELGTINSYDSLPQVEEIGQGELTIAILEERLSEYLIGREDLEVGEIMIFDNHAYAQIIERDTGIGAMEILVDPVSLQIAPEFGPNMMWNLKYGPRHGRGMMGYRSYWEGSDDMPIGTVEAVAIAQAFLDRYEPGLSADEHADVFYGYYTLHTEREGEVIGMLSVNGYTGQVFPHTWHGELITMSDAGDF